MDSSGGRFCIACGTELSTRLLSCPSCHALVHAAELRRLASDAERAIAAGQAAAALEAWRNALTLLPADSRQYAIIRDRIDQLGRATETPQAANSVRRPPPLPGLPASETRPPVAATAGTAKNSWRETPAAESKKKGIITSVLVAIGLVLWKLKFVVAFLLTKGKLLLLGLTKLPTLGSMLLSLGPYWVLWGWKFALGLVVSIYIHEMGHVVALKRLGIPATAPMFIPFLGAVIRTKQYPTTPHEDAQVGLAGPLWGLGAAAGAFAVAWGTGWQSWGAIAQIGALINLFNLVPVWQLDGARGFRAMNRWERVLATLSLAGAWWVTHEGLLLLIALVAAWKTIGTPPAEKADRTASIQYIFLVAALSAIVVFAAPQRMM